MGKEGVDFNFKIHPVTAFLIAFGLGAGIFGAGRYSVNIPFLKLVTIPTIKPSPIIESIWKETAFTGKLQFSANTQKYFLLTTSSEAITLDVTGNLDLFKLVGKRIMAVGEYNKSIKLLKVMDVKDLEVLPNTPVPIPTIMATATSTASPEIIATPTEADTME